MKFQPLAIAVVAACAAAPVAADGLVPKQLAGAPSEFAAMRPIDPASAAIHSKSALIPLGFTTGKAGVAQWSGRLPVQDGRVRFLTFSRDGSPLDVELVGPNGQRQNAKTLARSAQRAEFGIEQEAFPADYYAFNGLVDGDWTLKIRRSGDTEAYLLVEGDSATELASYPAHRKHLAGETQQIVALLTHSDGDTPALLGNDAGLIEKAMLRVTYPTGKVREFPMHDDGQHGDGLAGDGVYGASFVAKSGGNHLAQVLVEGRDLAGRSLLRSAEHVVPVVESGLAFAGHKAAATRSKDGRQHLTLPVFAQGKSVSGHYRVYAEVWGRNAKGSAVPVAWIGGMSELGSQGLGLGLDERWIAKSGAQGPFELRNLRIEDPDHFVTVLGTDRLDLDMQVAQMKAQPNLAIDERMTMGPRPADLDMAKGTGSRLLLVHGYCSGGVWPTANFTNASTFLDKNQNRTHDQFARLIQTFGNTWNSYGIVAHSQGGAAALHLYTYYWSGLDNASGSRLIQSVGTPYQGTNLAGILATLGSWFGVGCGTNSNLSYSGAKSWLAGIPTSARAKVNYYTTAFRTTNWWTNDYCQFATDLVLSDPEDGTTEKAYGQLPGAVNRGHTDGQCHTSGMRDPAQYLDSSRNATMNSNAAR